MTIIDSSVWIDYFNDFTLLHADRDFIPFANHFGLKTL